MFIMPIFKIQSGWSVWSLRSCDLTRGLSGWAILGTCVSFTLWKEALITMFYYKLGSLRI